MTMDLAQTLLGIGIVTGLTLSGLCSIFGLGIGVSIDLFKLFGGVK